MSDYEEVWIMTMMKMMMMMMLLLLKVLDPYKQRLLDCSS